MERGAAEALLEEWVRTLGLEGWEIRLEPEATPYEMQLQDAEGETEWNETIRFATVRILKEDCRPKDCGLPFDWERVLVHELLHIKFAFLWDREETLHNRVCHQVIEDLARAMCRLKREKR